MWRGAFWAGVALVLLTGIARNYDQTFIVESPVLWLFGPLLFSFVSGSWLYFVVYGLFARREMVDAGGVRPKFWSGWRSFMGLFWLTAPIAWLYAIPVERFTDSFAAVKLNLTLLALVSLWRVLLMARVMQVITSAPLMMTMAWVLFAAALEVCVVYVFDGGIGGIARSIMVAMGGMRNSPEEEMLLSAMGTAFSVALCTVPISLIIASGWRPRRPLGALPQPQLGPMPWRTLAAWAAFWVAVAIVPQRELANTVTVERLLAEGRGRAALDFLASHQPLDFAPARMLPPRPYERNIFLELPPLFGAVLPSDPDWVRAHLMQRLELMQIHYGPDEWHRLSYEAASQEQKTQFMADRIRWMGPEAGGFLQLLDGLERIPEGRLWLEKNLLFLGAVRAANMEASSHLPRNSKTEAEQEADRLLLLQRLDEMGVTEGKAGNGSPP